MKKNSNGRWPPMEDDLKIFKVEYIGNRWLDLSLKLNIEWNEDNLQSKTTWKIKSEISQQPLIGYSSNFKLNLRGPNQIVWNETDLQWKTT